MDKRKLALFGGVAAVLLYHEWKIHKIKSLVFQSVDILDNHLEIDFQRDVDAEFDEIVESYED